jgi:hypothetical protein
MMKTKSTCFSVGQGRHDRIKMPILPFSHDILGLGSLRSTMSLLTMVVLYQLTTDGMGRNRILDPGLIYLSVT